MATSQFSDFYVPVKFSELFRLNQLEKNVLVNSGVGVSDTRISNFLNSDGTELDMRYIGQLEIVEPNQSSDDPSTKAVPNKRDGGSYKVRKQLKNQGWSSMDLLPSVNGLDPLQDTVNYMIDYWNSVSQVIMVKSSLGVLADNEANHGGDMVEDISITSGTITDDNLISANSIIDATITMGDKLTDLGIMAMHSIPYARLQKLNLIDFIPDSRGEVDIATYQGKRVLVDDTLPVDVTVPTHPVYTTMLFGAGAYLVDIVDQLKNPMALQNDEFAGNGSGEETLFSRKQLVVHPQGYSYNSANNTYADLIDAANWTRDFDRKRIKIAFLKTNG